MKKILKISSISFLTKLFLTTAHALLLSGATMAAINTGEQVLKLPHGTSDSWLAAAQEEIRISEYNITASKNTPLSNIKATYCAPNRAHNLRVTGNLKLL